LDFRFFFIDEQIYWIFAAAYHTKPFIFGVSLTKWLQVIRQPTFSPDLVSKWPFSGGGSTNFGGFWWIFGHKKYYENIQSINDNKNIYTWIVPKHKKL